MATKHDLQARVIEALQRLVGENSVLDVCREVWSRHEDQLQASGDLFYAWPGDIRWAAQKLRDASALAKAVGHRNRPWRLASS